MQPDRLEHLAHQTRHVPQQLGRRLVKVLVLLEVDEGLDLPAGEEEPGAPRLVRAPEVSGLAADRRAPLLLRLGGERVAEGLDLREVQAVVEERALRELAGRRVADVLLPRRGRAPGDGGQRGFHRGGPAVDVKLEHILARDAFGTREVENEGARVYYIRVLPGAGIPQGPYRCVSGSGKRTAWT